MPSLYNHNTLIRALFWGRRITFVFTAALIVAITLQVFGLGSRSSLASERKTVIELFTSQGCAKCPPADAILRKLSKRSDIVALTLPISYWDYLGWKDTLALEANYERQQAYAKSRGDHEIYTPQIIVNGRIHVIGSHMDQVDAAIKRANAEFSNNRVALSLANKDGVVVLHADEDTAQSGSEPRKATLWVAFFTSSIEVKVNKGENNGQRLVYTNVVRAMTQAGQWKGEAVSYRVPIPHNTSIDGCAGFLQNDKSKEILGVELISLTSKQPLASRF